MSDRTAQNLVAEFQRATGGDTRSYDEIVDLRKRLLTEELTETLLALDEGDLFHIARELADLVYVAYGTALSLGIDLDVALTEVHRANMAKIGPDGTVTRGDGKILKPAGWKPPDMTSAIKGKMRTAEQIKTMVTLVENDIKNYPLDRRTPVILDVLRWVIDPGLPDSEITCYLDVF